MWLKYFDPFAQEESDFSWSHICFVFAQQICQNMNALPDCMSIGSYLPALGYANDQMT
jgi:hypothetical protein